MADIFEEYKNLKSFEVEFFDAEYMHRIMCKLRNIEPDKMLIVSDNSKTGNTKPSVGSTLALNVYSENGIYNSIAKVLDIQENDKETIYAITYPAQNKMTQRREYFRADLHIPYRITVKRSDKTDILEGETVNICGKGICIRNSKPFLAYDNCDVNLLFNHGRIITSNMEYVYSKTCFDNNKPSFLHAFMLTTIEQKDIDFIVGQCFLYQLS